MYFKEWITVPTLRQLMTQDMTRNQSKDNCLSKIQQKLIFGDDE